jgi:hypothetical protein
MVNLLFTTDTTAALRASESISLTALLVPQSTFRFLRFWIDEKQQLWCINLTRHTVAGVFLKGITGDSLYGCPPESIGNEGFERVSYQDFF